MATMLTASCGGDDDTASDPEATGAVPVPQGSSASIGSVPADTAASSDTSSAAPVTAGGGPAEVDTDVGVDDETIRVAILNDFSGPLASIGVPAATGAEIHFDLLNERGGICGRQVEVVTEDTKYDPQLTVQAYRGVVGDVVTINQLLGGASVFALAEDIARDGVMTLAGTLTAAVIPLEDVYVYLTPFPLEAINGISWAAENEAGDDGRLQLGVVYQADAYGEEGLAAAEFAAEQLGNVDLVATASYTTGDQDYTAQVQAMRDGGAEVVWLHATPGQTAAVLGVSAQLGFDALWIGSSATWASALAEPLGALVENYRIVNAHAMLDEDVEGMADLRQAMESFAPDMADDSYIVVGWVAAAVTAAALETACADGDLTRDGVVAAMTGLQVDLRGMGPNLQFGETPAERVPSRESRVNEIDQETTFPTPVTDYFISEPAATWELDAG